MRLSRPWTIAILLTLAVAAASAPVRGSAVEVHLKLPQRARLNLQGRNSVAVAPFIVVSKEGEEKRTQRRDIDVQKEFARYLLKVLRRETKLKVIEPGPVDFPVYDLAQLAKQKDF